MPKKDDKGRCKVGGKVVVVELLLIRESCHVAGRVIVPLKGGNVIQKI